jgi:ectoine hydroxylase-related dioxygenase (phytanoyl-CoA dioxygenase family)
VFDSNLWHAAGVNRSARPRRALTLAFTRPFVKQQLDYPRALGYDRGPSFSPALRQLLGYNARVPASLDEWYQPRWKRLYHTDQG